VGATDDWPGQRPRAAGAAPTREDADTEPLELERFAGSSGVNRHAIEGAAHGPASARSTRRIDWVG
jgi:hypothetical protein